MTGQFLSKPVEAVRDGNEVISAKALDTTRTPMPHALLTAHHFRRTGDVSLLCHGGSA